MIKHSSDSFVCWYCEKNLLNNRYVIKDNFAICLFCFEEKYSNRCFQCNQIIGIEMQGSTFKDKTWHNTCFNCSICNLSLINKKFAYQNEKLYCRHCFINEFAERCYRCNRSLEPGDKCIQYDKKLYHKSCFAITNDGIVYHNHPFHNECFVCTYCSIPLGNQRYIEHNNDAYCSNCSPNLFIKRTNIIT
ncbi:unnamed protein product [Rotaria sordida]|uniref:LIM zinc-binding domain-containing protein n=1 Tax=Rotaria sordida TaxID=392033 RepID=A0A813Y3X0_9BILA|nr:unnamed protein product [Rotaria sordida]CAF3535601.1 unnamed protein product [Rotaria sordida]